MAQGARHGLGIASAVLAVLLLASPAPAAPPPKYKDDPSTWSLKVGDAAYLVFKFPQRVFLCPFNELGGGVASRWGGRCLHWQLIAHPLSRGTNAHFWAEIIEPDGKLADHAKKFLSDSKMNTSYNEVTWKPEKVEKTALSIGGKPVAAYSATYKTKMLSTLSATALEVSGTFWMLDIEKSRVVLQEDNFKEKFDASDLMAKALSISKTPQWGDIKVMQTTSTSYRYLSMPPPDPAAMNQFPEGALVSWTFTAPDGSELGSIRLRQTFLGDKKLEEWKNDTFLNGLRSRNIPEPDKLVVPMKIGERPAFRIDFPTTTDDEKKRDCWIHEVVFADGPYAMEIYASSYDADRTKAAPFFGVLDKAIAGLLVWNAQ